MQNLGAGSLVTSKLVQTITYSWAGRESYLETPDFALHSRICVIACARDFPDCNPALAITK